MKLESRQKAWEGPVCPTASVAKTILHKYLWSDFLRQINSLATCSQTTTNSLMLMNWLFEMVCFATCLCWGFMEPRCRGLGSNFYLVGWEKTGHDINEKSERVGEG